MNKPIAGDPLIADLKIVRRLIRRPMRGWTVWAVLGSCFIAGLDMLGVAATLPLMQLVTGADPSQGVLGYVADLLGTKDEQALILAVAVAVGLAFALKSLATVAFRWWLLGHTTKLEAEAATELLRRYLLAPYWAHREREVSVIHRNLASAVGQTFGQVFLGLMSLLSDALTLAAILVVLLIVSPLVTLFAIVVFGLLGWAIQKNLKKRHLKIGRAIAKSDLDAWTALMPGLNGFREARLSSTAEVFVDRFGRAKADRAHTNRLASLMAEIPKYILEMGFVLGIASIALILFTTGTKEFALAVLGVFAAAAVRLLPTMNRVVSTIGGIRAGRVGMRILAEEVERLDKDGYHIESRPSSKCFSGDIELDQVTYRFRDSGTDVLRGVSTTIVRGQTTAFVGSSGAGKSTLLDIILGLLEPTSGTVRSGGENIFDDLPSWYSGLGVVPQDVFLLDDSLKGNIAFGEDPRDIDPARLLNAIELAQLAPLVQDMPEGLSTRLGERGVRLSGGQRQRVGIARALYRQPSILVLDEATAALDNVTERKISNTIESLSGTMTIILVAHRLSTVKNADKVVFMSNGRIEAEGSFTEVQGRSAEFAHLVALGKLG
ncbi:ABC transporter ATP-binding protein [Pseudarthrobacter sp. NamB4]|uniref:ABC transporter ATP-binding protein n=1 Tax=Pseudarthrobacter sp. NamB4 TaxID=2576837 RepID=UPI0010FDD541|nr:ABC transporter ATP-binding protein [Pseudarthrobacter sp. NamB4]TLM74498.1 ABC transporter ATP-binding protein [Pseudarthrobacter sp. NamB4]